MSDWVWLAPAVVPLFGYLRWRAFFGYGRWVVKNANDKKHAMDHVTAVARVMKGRSPLSRGESTEGSQAGDAEALDSALPQASKSEP